MFDILKIFSSAAHRASDRTVDPLGVPARAEILEWNSTRGRFTNCISGRIGRLVYFVSKFACRDFIGRCRWLVFVIARFIKSLT